MNKIQNRRTVNLSQEGFNHLSVLQAEIRIAMKSQMPSSMLSKTAVTNILFTLIKNADPKQVAKLLLVEK